MRVARPAQAAAAAGGEELLLEGASPELREATWRLRCSAAPAPTRVLPGHLLPATWASCACVAWAAVWFALRHLYGKTLLSKLLPTAAFLTGAAEAGPLDEQTQEKWRRLARQQTYNIFAVLAGTALALEYQTSEMLFWHFTWRHQVAFAAGCGHWVVALVEERSDTGCLSQAYRLHHAAAATAFAFCLSTKEVSAVGVAGLLFEVPVAILNVREALRLWPALVAAVPMHALWDAVLIAALLVRGGLLGFYLQSILRWPALWKEVLWPQLWHTAFATFTFFSISWFCLLLEWRRQDLREFGNQPFGYRTQYIGHTPVAASMETALGTHTIGAEVESGKAVAADELEQHITVGSCWLSIDGYVYDVTEFLDEHPGGRARILALAGGDASAEFLAVGHSPAARARLKGLLVAPLLQRGRGSTTAERPRPAREGRSRSLMKRIVPPPVAGALAVALKRLVVAVWSLCLLRLCPVSLTAVHVLLGFACVGAFCTLASLKAGHCGKSEARQGEVSANLCALALVATVALLCLAPLRAVLIGLVGALVLEAGLEPSPRASLRSMKGWACLAFYLVPGAIATFRSSLLLGAALALCLPVLSRAAPLRPASRRYAFLAIARVIRLAGLWAFIGWFAARRVASGPAGLSAWIGLPSFTAIASAAVGMLTAALGWFFLSAAVDLAAVASPPAVSRCAVFAAAVPLAISALDNNFGSIAVLGWFLQSGHLVAVLDGMTQTNDTTVPAYLLALRWMFDCLRGCIAVCLWFAFMKPAQALTSRVLPSGLRFYAFPTPLSDLEGRLKVGACLMLEGEQVEPSHFVCNVGHIPGPQLGDMMLTAAASLDIMDELDGGAPGLIANILCIVPDVNPAHCFCDCGWQSMREINLSVWQSAAAAQSWYYRSEAHADILAKHKGHGLKVFGNLLASLQPSRMQWQRRCQLCSSVVDGYASETCAYCPGKTYPIPRF